MSDPATLRQNTEDLLVRLTAGGENEIAESLIHPDFFNNEADPERSRGPAGAIATGEWLRSCFGAISWDFHHVLVDGNLAAAHRRILEHWAVRDDLGAMMQVGLLGPPPGA